MQYVIKYCLQFLMLTYVQSVMHFIVYAIKHLNKIFMFEQLKLYINDVKFYRLYVLC